MAKHYLDRDMVLELIKREFNSEDEYTRNQFLEFIQGLPMRRASMLKFEEPIKCKNCLYAEEIVLDSSTNKEYKFLVCDLGAGIKTEPDMSCNLGIDKNEIEVRE